MKATIKQREHYTFFLPIQTRWADNDLYGHVNNVTYYSYFDTAANALLIQEADFDPKYSPMIGLVVSSNCQFNQELSYPEIIEVGVAIESMGSSMNSDTAAAQGSFVHVFVDRYTRKSTPIPVEMRDALSRFVVT